MNSFKRLAAQPVRAPSPRVIVRFPVAFIVAILLWFAVRDPLVGLHVRVTNVMLGAAGHSDAGLVLQDNEMYLRIQQPAVSENGSTDRLYRKGNRHGTSWSSIFYLTFLLCIPLRAAARRWRYLLAVALIFFAVDNAILLTSALCHPMLLAGGSGAWAVTVQRHLATHSLLLFTLLCLLFLPLFAASRSTVGVSE